MDDKHELVSKLKELALELGRVPKKAEFTSQVRGGDYKLSKIGGYTILLQAAGMETYNGSPKPRNIDNSVFETSVERHLESIQPIQKIKQEAFEDTLFIGDAHHPFSLWDVIEYACEFARIHQPKYIVQGGDLYDLYSHSKFPRSHNIFLPKEENRIAREHAEKMWRMLKEAAPNAKCYQLWGNHDVRPLKRILEVYPSAEDWVERMMLEMMTFEGVETLPSYRDELILPGNVVVHHGYRSQLGQHRDYILRNAVAFHTHLGGVVYKNIHDTIIWELNGGFVGDPRSKGLSYTPQKTTHWTNGLGWLDKYGPRFIPWLGKSDA